MDAITRAQNNAHKSLERCRKAVAEGSLADAVSPSAMSRATARIGQHREQYAHFRDWPYIAIRAISNRLAAQPIYVGKLKPAKRRSKAVLNWRSKAFLDAIEPLDSHPLLDALADPNPIMTRWSLISSLVSSLELTGKSLLWLLDGSYRGTAFDLFPLPAHWAKPLDTLNQSWEITIDGGTPFPAPGGSIAYFNLPNPGDPFDATSPLQTQAKAVDTDTQLQTAQSRSLENGLWPGMVIKVGNVSKDGDRLRLNQQQRQQLLNAVKARYRGTQQFGEPFIVDGMVEDIRPLTTNPSEMAFLESGQQVKSRILQAYGVNPIILGEIQGANRAQAAMAEESLCTNVLNPLAELISQVLSKWMVPAFGDKELVVWMEPCRAHDSEITLKEWELGSARGFVTPNEYRTRVLGLPAIAGGDTRLVPMGVAPETTDGGEQ